MARREEDSVVNLTKPTLFSIYDKEVTTSEQDYRMLRERLKDTRLSQDLFQDEPGTQHHLAEPHAVHRTHAPWLHVLISLAVLFWFGVVFAKLSTELYDNQRLQKWMIPYTLATIANWAQRQIYSGIPHHFVYGTLGVLCGISAPLLDKLVYQTPIQMDNDMKSILKCLNALLGICLGVRTIQWSSSIQASLAWWLLNIILWASFDSTLTILLMGTLISAISCTITNISSTMEVPIFISLYIMDFYFFGYLIFGKLGRYLFK